MQMRIAVIAAALVMTSSAGSAQQTKPPDSQDRWVIVQMPSGIQVPPLPNPRPGVWRLNTQTGALQFCYYDGVGAINCSVWNRPSQ
jgi:hypothetical protein